MDISTLGGVSYLKPQMCVCAAQAGLVMESPVGDVVEMEGGAVARQVASH